MFYRITRIRGPFRETIGRNIPPDWMHIESGEEDKILAYIKTLLPGTYHLEDSRGLTLREFPEAARLPESRR